MSRNISSVVDDDVYDFVEDERLKKGVLKSKAVNILLRDVMDKTNDVSKIDGIIHDRNRNEDLIKKMENIISDNERIIEKAQKFKGDKGKEFKVNKEEPKDEKLKFHLDLDSNVKSDQSKQEPKPQETLENLLDINSKELKKQNIELDNVIKLNKQTDSIKKDQESKNVIKDNNVEKRKYTFNTGRRGIKMNDENILTGISERDIDHIIEERMRKKKFDESFSDVHKKIQDICIGEECTKNELADLKNKTKESFEGIKKDYLSKIDTLCEDGKCLKSDMNDIKKTMEEIKKSIKKPEICPDCGYTEVPGLASYCPECGKSFKGWINDRGEPVRDWKHYTERLKNLTV